MSNTILKHRADSLKINIYPTMEDMSVSAAADAQKFLRAAISVKGRATVVLATGNSQIQFLEHFTAAPGIDWSLVTLFHLDEYLGLPADHPASFRRYLKERVEDRVHPHAFHYLKGDALEPILECLRYEAMLTTAGIDLVCMGIGENGHLAFNDPPVANFKDEDGVKLVKLDDACRQQQVNEGHFPSIDAVPLYAMTLTIPQLLKADRVQVVVPERRKAEAVRATLLGPISTECPASILRTQKHATLYVDADAASLVDIGMLKDARPSVSISGLYTPDSLRTPHPPVLPSRSTPMPYDQR